MKVIFSKRRKARLYAMQALYSWRLTKNNLNDIKHHLLESKNHDKIDLLYFDRLLFEIPEKTDKLNAIIQPHSNLEMEYLDHIELTILQIAVFELTECIEIPYKVVINEALELCKKYGSVDGYKFVNGVLDRLVENLNLK